MKRKIFSIIIALSLYFGLVISPSAAIDPYAKFEAAKEFASGFTITSIFEEGEVRHPGESFANPYYSASAPVSVTLKEGMELPVVIKVPSLVPGSVLMLAPREPDASDERVEPVASDDGSVKYILEPGLYYFAQHDVWSAIGFAILVQEQAAPAGLIRVTLDDRELSFDQPLIIENGRTLVPLRFIAEALGSDVDWNQSTQVVTAIKDETTVIMQIGSHTMTRDGMESNLDVPPQIVNSRTLVPVRAITEAFDLFVDWDSTNRIVVINSNSKEQLAGLVKDAMEKLQSSEWLTYTFRAFSRYENRVTGILSEHYPSGTIWYREITMTEADNGDNTLNPTVSKHYLLFDGKLYSSEDGKNWQTIDVSSFTFREVPTLSKMMQMLPPIAYDEAYREHETSSVWFSYYDDFPTEPTDDYVGVNHHRFVIDLGGRGLSSYFLSTVPAKIEENGELTVVAPSTTFYSVIDMDYQPFTIPKLYLK